jgi:serine/threonine protein kinase
MSASSSDPAAPRFACCPTCQAVFRGTYRRCPNDGAILIATDDDPLVGSVLAERYQIEEVLGDGGLGRVYRARHVRMSRRFAIKVPFGEVGYDRKARARLANEAEAASRLDHPHVIGIVDVGETAAGLFYIAMDLAEGRSLAELLEDGPPPPAVALGIFAQLADGLTHAHERGLVHRDLKPDNVMVTHREGGVLVARVIDFGLALVSEGDAATRLTTEGMVVGTPYYMAPEQTTGDELDHRTDLFALGIILFELLAGRLPFDGTPQEIARQNLAAAMPSIASRADRPIEPMLEVVVRWLTRKRRDERPSTTREVLELARHLAAGERDRALAVLPAWVRAPLAPPPGARPSPEPSADAPVPAPLVPRPSAPASGSAPVGSRRSLPRRSRAPSLPRRARASPAYVGAAPWSRRSRSSRSVDSVCRAGDRGPGTRPRPSAPRRRPRRSTPGPGPTLPRRRRQPTPRSPWSTRRRPRS